MTEDDIIREAISILDKRLRKPEHYLLSAKDTKTYLKLQFEGVERESFRVLFLDTQYGLIADEELFMGTIDGAAIYPREVVKATLKFNAAAVIFSHNHPSGNCEPSLADRNITQKLVEALKLIDVRVLDHIVVGGNRSCSFAERGLL